MDAEDLLHSLPRFNRVQILIVIYEIFFALRGPWQVFGIAFIADAPDQFSCQLSQNQSPSIFNSTECEIIDTTSGEPQTCSEWDYQFYRTNESIINEWNLVCDKSYYVWLDQTLYMAGQMAGALFLSNISDWHGRKPTILVGALILLGLSVVLMLSVDPIMFIAIRVAMGVANQVVITASYVLMAEWFEIRWRTIATNSIMMSWVGGVIAMSGIAYLTPKWRQLVFFYNVIPGLISVILALFLTESLFYLVTNHKYTEVEKIMNKAHGSVAITKPRSTSTIATMESVKRASQYNKETIEKMSAESKGLVKKAVISILKSKKMLGITLVLFWLSLSNNMNYYVATLETSSLSGDKYLNFALSGLVEFPFVAAGTFLSVFAPRSVLLFFLYFISFVSYILFTIWPEDVFAFVGRGAISSVYIVQILYTTEMFPTAVRNAGLGFIQIAENLGPVFGPIIVKIIQETTGSTTLYILFGAVGMVNAILVSCLPETKGFNLPETVDCIEKRPAFAAWRIILMRNYSVDGSGASPTAENKNLNKTEEEFLEITKL